MKKVLGVSSAALATMMSIVIASTPVFAQKPTPPPATRPAPVPYGTSQPVPYSGQPIAGGNTARPVATNATPDTIYLKSGGILRGTLIDAIPNAHARIQLPTGEVATVTWSEIQRIEAAAKAGVPPQATAQPQSAAPPVIPLGPTVMVHIDSPKTVNLEQLRGGTWTTVCRSPCDKELPTTEAEYRMFGEGMRVSKPFTLEGTQGQTVVLEVDPASKGWFALSIVAISLGGVVTFIGLIIGAVGSACESATATNCSGVATGGWITFAIGAGMTIGGIFGVVQNSKTSVAQEPLKPGAPVPPPQESAAVRRPIWRDASATDLTPRPSGITVPIFSGSF